MIFKLQKIKTRRTFLKKEKRKKFYTHTLNSSETSGSKKEFGCNILNTQRKKETTFSVSRKSYFEVKEK